ncbi:MAG: hypothetical protein KAJ14_13375, partial [Candidatus Omnitrophica bacterium]|nr:hypothetical protein [Candidatus Omnitrophota bacterium]
MMFITLFHNLLTKGDSGGQSQRIVPFVAGIALVDGGKSLFSEEGFEFKDNEIEMGWIDWVIGAPAFTVILLAELTIFLASKFISTIELENNFIIRTLSRLPLKTAIVFIMFVIVLSAGLSIPVAANADTVTVNDTIDKQVNITNFNNEKIIEDLRENRGISFVKNQTLGDLIVYTEIASKDATTNGQILYVVDTNRGFAVEYIDSEPFIMSFNDGRESLFLEIDEDLGKGALKVRDDETGILYDYREKNIGDYKVLIIEDPLPVEFSDYLDKNGGYLKKEGSNLYFHFDENDKNKEIAFLKRTSSKGEVFLTYDSDSFEDIVMPKEGIFVNGNKKITFSEINKDTMVDNEGGKWSTDSLFLPDASGKEIEYVYLSERFVNKQDELEEDVLVNETIIPIETPEVQINETPGFKFSIAIVSLFLALGLRNRRCKKTQGSKFIAKDVDGGNRIDTNLPLNLPYSLPIMLLFGLTSFSGKNVENYIGMSLAGRGNIIRIKFKTTLNSVIVFQNSNFVNEFMKWLARLETSPPGINAFQVKYQVYPHLILSRLKRRYKTIKLQFIESLREISVYLVFLINTTINCTPNKVIATSHGYIRTTSHGKAFSFSGVDLVLFLNRFVEALFVASHDLGVSANFINAVVYEDGGNNVNNKDQILKIDTNEIDGGKNHSRYKNIPFGTFILEIGNNISVQVKQHVRGSKEAQKFWKDTVSRLIGLGKNASRIEDGWLKKFYCTKERYAEDYSSKQFVYIERELVREIVFRCQKEFSYDRNSNNLNSELAWKDRKLNCLVFSELAAIIFSVLGIQFDIMLIDEMDDHGLIDVDYEANHIALMVNFEDGTHLIADIANKERTQTGRVVKSEGWPLLDVPFIIEDEFSVENNEGYTIKQKVSGGKKMYWHFRLVSSKWFFIPEYEMAATVALQAGYPNIALNYYQMIIGFDRTGVMAVFSYKRQADIYNALQRYTVALYNYCQAKNLLDSST